MLSRANTPARQEIRRILEAADWLVPLFSSMSLDEQEELIDAESWIDSHAPVEVTHAE